MATLAEAFQKQRRENQRMRGDLEEKSRLVRSLEGQLLEANQKRQDVAKRVDELISQLDYLDGELDNAEL